ncbi:MAG: 2-oxoglutarate ferredoxin oxidoreductase subunit alpha [Anaerolineaceae bacterium]|nr:MAG: 2-oxoglutarate ferredoxin oxidoreductase subunit alpha [Anaerolineaceae bacterium]
MAVKLMQGNEAIAKGAVAAGCRFYAGYPITPSTEVAEVLSRELPKVGGKFIQMEDEIASMAAIIGARVGGLKSMTATSGPGFSLMQENIGYAAMTEVPCVIVNVQRLGPSTGQPTAASQGDVMQARWGTHGDHPIIVLSPISVRHSFDLTIKAFDFSEKYRTPVILLTDEIIGHMREPVELPDFKTVKIFEHSVTEKPADYKAYRNGPGDVPPMAAFGTGYRYHITGLFHDEVGFPTQRLDEIDPWLERVNTKLTNHMDEIALYEEDYEDGAKVALLSYGCSARTARHAMKLARAQGQKVDLLSLFTIWPFPEKQVEALGDKVDRIVVPEMNRGQLALEVERIVGRKKVRRVGLANGEMVTPQMVLEKMGG